MKNSFISFLVLLLSMPAAGEDKWIRLRTANFEIFTPQSEKKARETALYFEQLREFFLSYWKTKADPGTPVRILLFGNEKQYAPFRPHEKAAGYFQHGMDRDWIVISGYLEGWERIVTHEYTHLMVKQAGLNLPTWLNEGIAEVYSTFKPIGGKVQIGDLIPGHFHAVSEGWVPVPRLFEVKHDSPEYNGKGTAQFYAGSWGLTHMLMLDAKTRQTYAPVLAKIMSGVPSGDAFQTVSMTPEKLDVQLRGYLKNNDRFFAGVIPFKSEKSAASWNSEHIAMPEVDTVLAALLVNSPALRKDAKARLARLDPALWQSQETLAYAAWHDHDMAKANGHFQQAVSLGATSPKLYYDAARAAMYSGDKNQDSVKYLQKAIELYPEWIDARLQLMEQHLFLGTYGNALAVSAQIKTISPQKASRFFRGAAYSEAGLSAADKAQLSMKRARDYAKTDFDRAECDRLESFLDRISKSKAQPTTAVAVDLVKEEIRGIRERADAEDASSYREDGGTGTRIVRSPESIDFTGTLTNLDCGAPHSLLTLTGQNGQHLELEILDPTQVNLQIVPKDGETKYLDLQCGAQNRKVKIVYLPPGPEAVKGTRGQLRAIEYL